jgi:hypothetical protein
VAARSVVRGERGVTVGLEKGSSTSEGVGERSGEACVWECVVEVRSEPSEKFEDSPVSASVSERGDSRCAAVRACGGESGSVERSVPLGGRGPEEGGGVLERAVFV